MLVSQAHSFARQSRLAITLAWVAGYTNIVALLICGVAVSHMTGTASQWGLDVVRGRWGLVAFTSFMLAAFVAGAALATLCIELGRRRSWASIYIWPMAIEALLLAAFAIGVELHVGSGRVGPAIAPEQAWVLWTLCGLAAAAMGLQNATVTRLSSGAVRTTHMTGVLTDLGHDLVQVVFALRERGAGASVISTLRSEPSARHLALLASIFGSFALGAGLGALAHEHAARWAMIPPVLFLLWIIWQDTHAPIAAIEESSIDHADLGLPASMAVYHLRRQNRKVVHRLPDLQRWFERLPASKRVIVLDMSEASAIDDNAALELRAVVRQASVQGRSVVVAGLDAGHYAALLAAGAGDTLDASNICADLDLAIARGVMLAST